MKQNIINLPAEKSHIIDKIMNITPDYNLTINE